MRRAFRRHLGPVPAGHVSFSYEIQPRGLNGEAGYDWALVKAGCVQRAGWTIGDRADAEWEIASALRDVCRPIVSAERAA
jgi:hypothetical protein